MTIEVDYLTDPPTTVPASVPVELDHNTEHAAEAKSHLIEYFRNGPRSQAILDAVMVQVQEVEDVLWYVRNAFNVDTAVGEQLDFIGKRVGERRAGKIDSTYRQAIRVRILVNRSTGTLAELLTIVELINPAADFTCLQYPDAALTIQTDDFGDLTLQDVYLLLRQAKPAGVRLMAVEGTAVLGPEPDGEPYGFVLGSSAHTVGDVIGSGT